MKILIRCKDIVEKSTNKTNLSYVDVARNALGESGAYFVFTTQFLASMGVCSAYFAFIGSTLEGLTNQEGTWINKHMGDWTKIGFQRVLMAVLMPITFLRSIRFLRFTSTLGTVAVFLALIATMADGIHSLPSWQDLGDKVSGLPLWPEDFHSYAQSFGCITFLFMTNFMILPIERGMKRPENFKTVLNITFVPITIINMSFATICFAFVSSFFVFCAVECILIFVSSFFMFCAVECILNYVFDQCLSITVISRV